MNPIVTEERKMAKNIWFISDTHFHHANILKFTDKDGKRFRGDLFSSVEEMNEILIERWNERVKPQDKIYNLGDVVVGSNDVSILSRLNGHKRLLLGNHDPLGKGGRDLLAHFEKIGVWRMFKEHKFVCSHIPITQSNFRHKCVVNVHGHIHQNDAQPGPYINISCEKTNYAPVHYDEIVQMIKDKGYL